MDDMRKAKKRIILESYIRIVFISVVGLGATNMCGFIDNIVIGRFLGADHLAAVGFFLPITVASGLPYVLVMGTSLMAGNLIGSGKREDVNSLFTGAFYTILLAGAAFVAMLVLFRGKISDVLGASGVADVLLEEYILGYAPGMVFASLASFLLSLSSFNNAIKVSYVATAVMFFGNAISDVLLAKPMGIFGIGMSSTISSLAMFMVLLPGFMKKTNTIHFVKPGLYTRLVKNAIKRGMPVILFNAGLLIKNSLLNYSLIQCSGDEGIAVVNVLGSVCGMTGAFLGGFSNAHATLSSLYYGEEDREGFLDLFRYARRYGLICTVSMMACAMVFAGPLAGVFFTPDTSIWELGKKMFILGFLYLPINMFYNLVINCYKVQNRMLLTNILSFVETGAIGILALFTTPLMGADAAWLANTWSDILCVIIIYIAVFVYKKKISFALPDLMKLSDDFGASPEQVFEKGIMDKADVTSASEAVVELCKRCKAGSKKAFLSGLCVEEMTRNIIEHGGFNDKNKNISVRVVCKKEVTIRIQDDCERFDPCERMNLYTPKNPEENIGLRMVGNIAASMDYYNNAGINTLIIKL